MDGYIYLRARLQWRRAASPGNRSAQSAVSREPISARDQFHPCSSWLESEKMMQHAQQAESPSWPSLTKPLMINLGRMPFVVLLLALVAAAVISLRKTASTADLIVINCEIWTADKDVPWADSMAIRKGRILRLGSLPFVQELAGPGTESLDLKGQFVAPGFIDSHVHFIPGGLQMEKLYLHDVKSRSEFEREIENAAHGLEHEVWLLGSGWSNENWGGEWPNSSWIDRAAGNHPVWLTRIDGHMGLANRVALEKCHLLDDTKKEPVGGRIVRHENGVPTGLLLDAAMELILSCIPKPSLDERKAALARAGKHAVSRGVTSVVDFGAFFPGASTEQGWEDFNEVYTWADAVGSMSVRAVVFLPMETWPRVAALVREKGHILSNWLRIGGVKAFADGSLGSSTARFHEPYADDSSNFGLHVADPEWLYESVDGAYRSNLQVAVHAIGDAANDQVLSIFNAVISKSPRQGRRLRIEHVQHLSNGAHIKFAQNSVIASVQPEHLLEDAVYAGRKLGEERSSRSYNFRSLLGNGSILALGSDWPVAPLDPLGGIQAAVKRRPHGWEHPWLPEESITIADALLGYTSAAAYAAHVDELVGSLRAGKVADFVVLSESPFGDGAMPFLVATYVGGVKAHPVT